MTNSQSLETRFNKYIRQCFKEQWISTAALTSAVFAVAAGLTGASATSHGNKVTRELIQNANQWNYFQAKGIKANLLQTKIELMTASKLAVSQQDRDKLKEYRLEQDHIVERTKEQDLSVDHHLKLAGLFTRCVTFLQIAMGVIAVSILVKSRTFWLAGVSLASYGLYFAGRALFY